MARSNKVASAIPDNPNSWAAAFRNSRIATVSALSSAVWPVRTIRGPDRARFATDQPIARIARPCLKPRPPCPRQPTARYDGNNAKSGAHFGDPCGLTGTIGAQTVIHGHGMNGNPDILSPDIGMKKMQQRHGIAAAGYRKQNGPAIKRKPPETLMQCETAIGGTTQQRSCACRSRIRCCTATAMSVCVVSASANVTQATSRLPRSAMMDPIFNIVSGALSLWG